MKTIIEVGDLKKEYSGLCRTDSTTALDGVNLTVQAGEFIGIMGASGSGKTTLLNVLTGVDNATSGQVNINGNDITKMKKDELALFRRREMGYVFQDFNLLNSLTVKENIALPLILDKVPPKQVEDRVHEMLTYFEINEVANKYPYRISGGQKQRAAAARALIANPTVIFADEPTGNLDSKSAHNTMQMLSDINSEHGATILMVTHDTFAASWCKRIIFIKDGKIHNEIQSTGGRIEFFDKILGVLHLLGGGQG